MAISQPRPPERSHAESTAAVTARFLAVVAEVLGLPAEGVNDDMGPATFGQWTSLRHIQHVAAMEDAYGVHFSPREVRSVRTVGGLRDILGSKGIIV